jgi:hypothetical protein
MPTGLIDEQRDVRARHDLGGDFGQVMPSVSHRSMTRAAPLPSLGQIAPNI